MEEGGRCARVRMSRVAVIRNELVFLLLLLVVVVVVVAIVIIIIVLKSLSHSY